MLDVLEVAEEGAGGELAHLLPGGASYGQVGGDQADDLAVAVIGGEPLEERIGVTGVADGERADVGVRADAVEDDDAASTADGHEVGQPVGELPHVGEPARVQEVVPVEQVERRISHSSSNRPSRGWPSRPG